MEITLTYCSALTAYPFGFSFTIGEKFTTEIGQNTCIQPLDGTWILRWTSKKVEQANPRRISRWTRGRRGYGWYSWGRVQLEECPWLSWRNAGNGAWKAGGKGKGCVVPDEEYGNGNRNRKQEKSLTDRASICKSSLDRWQLTLSHKKGAWSSTPHKYNRRWASP